MLNPQNLRTEEITNQTNQNINPVNYYNEDMFNQIYRGSYLLWKQTSSKAKWSICLKGRQNKANFGQMKKYWTPSWCWFTYIRFYGNSWHVCCNLAPGGGEHLSTMFYRMQAMINTFFTSKFSGKGEVLKGSIRKIDTQIHVHARARAHTHTQHYNYNREYSW